MAQTQWESGTTKYGEMKQGHQGGDIREERFVRIYRSIISNQEAWPQ